MKSRRSAYQIFFEGFMLQISKCKYEGIKFTKTLPRKTFISSDSIFCNGLKKKWICLRQVRLSAVGYGAENVIQFVLRRKRCLASVSLIIKNQIEKSYS